MINSLKPTLEKKGKTVTQIIHFVGNVKRTFRGVITSSIQQGQFTKFELVDGRLIQINDCNVLAIEVFAEKKDNEKRR